tara:strand:- start:6688 stop:7284 length:597 start_codon:yes stop_codon:yes gene_type:complete
MPSSKTTKMSTSAKKVSKSKKTSEPKPEPVSDVITSADDTEVEQSPESYSDVHKRIIARQMTLKSIFTEQNADIKTLEKLHKLEVRSNRKKKQRGGNSGVKKSPSGFAKPTEISPELRTFLKVADDTLLARTEVTKRITTYIKENDLQNPENRREIFPDAKLSKLVNMDQDDKLTYFNLQRCIKHHFPPKKSGDAVSS